MKSKKPEVLSLQSALHIRTILQDGRCNCLVVWEDGEWKVEIFASEAHARKFADEHKMEVINHASDQRS